ncbi:30S ribosomal protein S9 [endosymbiont of Euscepes postfasciatus]|uniref:30S ribosomal protein S9 n=1 Tax=endosymbiont of Euscepes postfasciatus TaxID=650377 RepID=UPI000DC71BF2|nr:30S ribosomal protein S9 [endosymbiont of Euscepes postfasciatus]BBA84606.1 30S ribosomal protein S9 [endosymbiont of Euscepes postfasciatus]
MKNYFYGTGKRKNAISRVFIKNGNGNFVINNKKIDIFCRNNFIKENIIIYPIKIVNLDLKKFDILITVKGGGEFGQIYSIRHGISKALLNYDINYKSILKKNKLITRDSRKVERKKFGFKKSRKRIQFSKR